MAAVASWVLAARPRTLPVAVGPVFVGTALAAAHGQARAGPALAALAGALLLQVAANLANDLFDFEKGADTAERLGPPRAAQLGLLSRSQLRAGIAAALGLAALVGLYLIAEGGWPIALVGIVSIAAALAYTGGPLPFGYRGLGDAAVFLFFGVVAVGGTYWVQAGTLPGVALVAAVPVGWLATAILVVNNLRDVDTDRAAGKRTLAVRLGRRAARMEYAALVLTSYLVAAYLAWRAASPALLLPLVTLPWAGQLVRRVATLDGSPLNEVLVSTAHLGLAFSALFALGWLV